MRKLNKKQIEEIKNSKELINVLAKRYNVTPNAIKYYVSEEFRQRLLEYNRERYKKLTKEQKKELLDKKREYQREYHRKKYEQDPKYREKQIERAKKYQKEKTKHL